MEILDKFGFEPTLFIAQIINFLILAYLFKRFLYTPLLKLLKERQEKIKKGVADSEKATKLIEETEKDRDEILKKTRIEAEKILDDAKKIAEESRTKILEDSKREAEKIINEGKTQAGFEMEKVEKRINIISLDISKKILNNILTSLFTEDEKNKIMKKATLKLEEVIKNE